MRDRRDLDAETQLDRELDEASPAKQRRLPPPPSNRTHRVAYSLSVVVVVSLVGGIISYLITTIVTRTHVSTTWVFVLAGIVIAGLAWGVSGANRARVTTTDRLVDMAISAVVASMVLGIVHPKPLSGLFSSSLEEARSFGGTGIGGVPRFHEIMTWSAVAACGAFALAALVRLALERARSPSK